MDLKNIPHFTKGEFIFAQEQNVSNNSDHKFWAKVFDFYYDKISDSENATADTSVWRNSYDGIAFSKEEMDDWIVNAIEKVKELVKPNCRVLEIGCGNGLIFSSIISDVTYYTGLDIAKKALSSISQSSLGKLHKDKISLYELPADAIHKIDGVFDLIIINSVAQYFPDLNYIFDLIEKCESKLNADGSIFLGDIRSFDLANDFYTDVAYFKYPDDELKAENHIDHLKSKESETLYSPQLFEALPAVFPWIKSSKISTKKSRFRNEMSRFRYDVILKTFGPSTLTQTPLVPDKLSNQLSRSVEVRNIDGKMYKLFSLHPKLFKLIYPYE